MEIKFKQDTTLKEALDEVKNIVSEQPNLDEIKNVINMDEIKKEIESEINIDFEGIKRIFDNGKEFIIEI